jgi:hypothetical protein
MYSLTSKVYHADKRNLQEVDCGYQARTTVHETKLVIGVGHRGGE